MYTVYSDFEDFNERFFDSEETAKQWMIEVFEYTEEHLVEDDGYKEWTEECGAEIGPASYLDFLIERSLINIEKCDIITMKDLKR